MRSKPSPAPRETPISSSEYVRVKGMPDNRGPAAWLHSPAASASPSSNAAMRRAPGECDR